MLTKIREKFTGGVAIAILALIGIPFLFFGIDTPFSGRQIAATVDGSDIDLNYFEQVYQDQLQRNPTWAQLPSEFRVQIRQSVLDSLIRSRLVELHLSKAGYQVSDTQLARTIRQIPDFQIDGEFDQQTAEEVLLQNGMTISQFRASQRQQLREQQLSRAVGATSFITPAEYRRYLNLIAEQRLVSMAEFDLEPVAAEIDVTEDMITTFYTDNDTLFQTEENADVEFIEINRDAVTQGIDIGEETLQAYYEDNASRYLQDEQRQARHILILFGDDEDAAEATAMELLGRVQAGESFEALAEEFSDDGGTASRGGDLGVLTRSQLPGELGGAIFTLSEGDVDGPVKTDFGFHVVKLDRVLEQGPLPLEQVRGDLLTELREREAEDAFRELERQVSDVLFDAPDMQSISAAVGLEVQTAAGFTRAGGEPIGSNQAAIDAVFDDIVLRGGEISGVIELDARRSAIFKVKEYREASRQPLEDVRDEIVAEMQRREAEAIVGRRAEELLAALDAGEDFGAAAEAAGATVTPPVLLNRQGGETDQAIVTQVFMADKPTQDSPVTGLVANSSGGYTVFNLDAVLPGRPESIPVAERDAGKLELAQQAGLSDYFAFVQALYDKADIVIAEDVLADNLLQ